MFRDGAHGVGRCPGRKVRQDRQTHTYREHGSGAQERCLRGQALAVTRL